jgi:AraC-like DNA-binding protein
MTTVQRQPGNAPAVFDEFRTAVSEAFVPLETTTDIERDFRGSIRGVTLDSVHINEVTADAHTVRRTTRSIRAADPEYYKVGLQVRGFCVLEQDGREAAMTPGDFAIYDTTRPYQLSFDDRFRMLVAMFPRRLLRLPPDGIADLTARRVSGRRGVGALVAPLLRGVGEQITETDPAVAVHLSNSILDVLAAAFAEQLNLTDSLSAESRQSAMRLRVMAFIDKRLHDPDLDVSAVATAHHVSVRYLQKTFEAQGTTVAGWIRARRLDQCRRDLADPHYDHLPVAAVGASWGLCDPAHFSRLFKSTFGLTPGQFRASRRVVNL